tara:strand:- start:1157 stop:2053 length:897 start_codon:yes stop_codon:yes gene_type:complete
MIDNTNNLKYLNKKKTIYLLGGGNESPPILFTNPHSGRNYSHYKNDIRNDLKQLRKMEDTYIDILLNDLSNNGFKILATTTPRIFLDLNRDYREIDKNLFFNCDIQNIKETRNLQSGYGLFFSKNHNQEPIYLKKLDWNLYRKKIDEEYCVFHNAIEEFFNCEKQKNSNCYLIDFHSMPSKLKGYVKPIPEICIGDNFGKSSTTDFREFICNKFQQQGFTVAKNEPFSGGYITQNYGLPNHGSSSIQIEIRKDIYLNEDNLSLNKNFFEVKDKIYKICEELRDYIELNNSSLNKKRIA